MNIEKKRDIVTKGRDKRIMMTVRVLLYPAVTMCRHPVLFWIALFGISLFARIYEIEFLTKLLNAYVTLSLMALVLSTGLVSRNKWMIALSAIVALLIGSIPLWINRLI